MRQIMFLIFITFCSCKKVVSLKLDSTSPKLVIEGNITDRPFPDTVFISRTVDFYADNVFPAVTGANVIVSDNIGNLDTLTEITPGVYITQTLRGKEGNTYYLTANVNDTIYTASSTMPQAARFDSVALYSDKDFGKAQITPVVNFQDSAGIANYYRFDMYINGIQFTKDFFVFDDRLSDGRYIQYQMTLDSAYLQAGDTLKIHMYCVDKNDYTYFNDLSQSLPTGAFNSDASPANPPSNISNGALGYFSAHTVRSKSLIVY